MAQLGRISGPLLKDNLLREGTDLKFETNLLYLDVRNHKLSINYSPTNKDLFVNQNMLTTNLIVDNLLTVQDIQVQTLDNIRSTSGSLVFSASDYVSANVIQTDDIQITNNVISTITPNTSLELRPNSLGTVEVFSNTNITGNLHATGDIVAEGDVVFGSDDTDSVTFGADVRSNFIPNITDFYNLGTEFKNWSEVYTGFYNGAAIEVDTVNLPGINNLALRPGKIWFVATNGLDGNQGNHQHSPFASITKALSMAESGDAIHIYPGQYIETFPLHVPTNVDIYGMTLRGVKVSPTEETKYKDAFLLNGDCTVTNITVSDFFYDQVNDTGYAFRFASGAKTILRSPYIVNVSVITRGSVTSSSDPLGFNTGDAGRGALVDGSVLDPSSATNSMLFHSVTFITPNADGLTMTNGVRVEWLNSFTYFCNRSLYATNGILGLASQGVKFGAEVRSISSASVYGNYGAYADGSSTLMYLIQYNFGYIGSGGDSSNDRTLIIQDNEITELNNGKIYFQSVDQSGNFRVGNSFYVDFDKGTTSINVSEGNITGLSSLTVNTGDNATYFDAYKIDVGNFVLRDNSFLTNVGSFNIVSASQQTNLNLNVSVEKNLAITKDVNIEGQLILGNQATDTVQFVADVDTNMLPTVNDSYTLGTTSLRWNAVFLKEALVGNLDIATNTIIPTGTNQNLVLEANGTGIISVPTNSVTITNDLTVNGTSSTKNVTVTGDIALTGNYIQTGSVTRTGDTNITGNLSVTGTVQFDDIRASTNQLTTTIGNNDLRLVATGTKIYVPSNNVQIDNNLTVNGTSTLASAQVSGVTTADQFSTGDVVINDNYITTTIGNNNLELRAAGTGKVYVPSDNVQFDQKLQVNGTTATKNVNITGNTTQTGNVQQTGNIDRTGNTNITGHLEATSYAQYQKLRIESNVLSSTATNTDLDLRANGTGKVIVPNNNVEITNNLRVDGTATLNAVAVTNTVTANAFSTGDAYIDDNYITTQVTDHNLELRANGTGKILVPNNNVEVVNNLTVNGITSLKNTTITGLLTHTGYTVLTGNITQTGNADLSGLLTVQTSGFFPKVSIVNNRISETATNTDLRLGAAGTGRIYVPSDNVRFDQTLTVLGTTTTGNINSSGTITANQFSTGDILIDDNFTVTTVGNNNLVLSGNNAGGVALEKLLVTNNTIAATQTNSSITFTPGTGKNLYFNNTSALKIPTGTSANRTMLQAAEFRFSTNDSVFSGFSTARRTMGGVYSADRLTKAVAHPTNNTITFTANSVNTLELLTDKIRANGLLVNNNFLLNNNSIHDLTTNADITLAPFTGTSTINTVSINEDTWTNDSNTDPLTIASTGDGHIRFSGTYGIQIPAGTTAEEPANAELGMLRYNIETESSEIYDGTQWISITGTQDLATAEDVQNFENLWILILG